MHIERILVTGASGKIGRSLMPALATAGYRVRALQFETPIVCEGVDVVQGSIRERDVVERALADVDAVVHLATSKEDPDGFLDVSVRGTFNLLDACRKQGGIRQFILAGGDAAAGIFFYPHPHPIDENAPLAAYPGYYAFSKVLEETMCNQYAIQYGLPVTILRFSWIHGDDDILAYMTLAEPNFGGPPWQELAATAEQEARFTDGADGVGCLVHTDGTPYKRHIVGIGDVVQAFLRALGNERARGETFNIAAPSAFSYDVLSSYIAAKLDLPVERFELDGFHDFEIDINKARSVLGYRPEYDVLRIVDEAIALRQSGWRRSPEKYAG